MAGIYDRINPGGGDRIDTHLIAAGFVLLSTGDFTKAQIVSSLNSRLTDDLVGAELADLTAIEGQIVSAGSATARIIYVSKLESLVMVAANGLVTESDFKSKLGI